MSELSPGHGVRVVRVEAEYAGQRIDNFLLRELKGVPRSRLYRLLRKGEVRVNRGRVKAEYRLCSGDEVRLPPIRQEEPAAAGELRLPSGLAQTLARSVIHEDELLLVVNKPSGMAVHGGSGLSWGLIEAFRALRPELRHLELVHRLDRDTSGCLLLSKRRSALRLLHEALRSGGMDKRYWALVNGRWPAKLGEVDQPLVKNVLRSGERMVRVSPEGKPSLTRFRVLEGFADATLVEASPITGRTHQIRVHALAAGHPILGDDKYGDREADQRFRERGLRRLFLHAHSLRFEWQGEVLKLQAALDPDLEAVLTSMRKGQ